MTENKMQFIPRNEKFRDVIIEHLERQEFMKHIECSLTIIEPGYVEAEIPFRSYHRQQAGILHGGVTATLADIVAGFAGFTLVEAGEHTITVEIKISYLRQGTGDKLRGVGRVVRAGRSFHFCEADVYTVKSDGTQEHIARATTTMAVISAERFRPTM